MCQQYLRGVHAKLLEAVFIGLYQPHLADSGRRLQAVQFMGSLFQSQSGYTLGNGPGRDQHHINTLCPQGHNLADPDLQCIGLQTTTITGQQRTAKLDDPASGLCNIISIL